MQFSEQLSSTKFEKYSRWSSLMSTMRRYEMLAVTTSLGCSKCSILRRSSPSTAFSTMASSPRMRMRLILQGFFEWTFFFFFLPARGMSIGFNITFPTGSGFWSMAVNWLYILSSQVIHIPNTSKSPHPSLSFPFLLIINPLCLVHLIIDFISMQGKIDLLGCASQKSIVKQFKNGETVFLSSPIFKFNDYKKKQERNILVTSMGVFNLKGTTIKRKIDIEKIKAVTVSKIGTEFIIHVPEEYDYRYASADRRDQIIYFILKAYRVTVGAKLPIYYREELNLVNYATTKEEKKKEGIKQIKGDFVMHNDVSFQEYLQGEQKQKEMVRKTTKTLYSRNNLKQQVTINDFVPKIVLGKGAFGTVLLVQKKNTKQLFAMKSINKDDIVKKDQIQHTKTEKMILEHVNHPFLVGLAYAFQTSNKLYFIMQFMRGGELFQHLSNAKRFPEKQAKFYAMQIALGLGHLHSKDFIYRDLKLENVLMDDNGNVSLTDFGMAKIVRDGQIAKTFCGTPEYLAPEVLEGGGYDKTADWWSLGILIYEMMHGLPPFYNKSQSLMFKLIKEGEVKFSEKVKISPQAQDFILKVLNKNPKQRLGAQGDVQEILGHAWFKDLNREKMLKKEIPPPFKPKIEGDQWLQGFDKEFTSELATYDEREGHKESQQYKNIFKNF